MSAEIFQLPLTDEKLKEFAVVQEVVNGEMILRTDGAHLIALLTFLRDDSHCLFKQLVDVAGAAPVSLDFLQTDDVGISHRLDRSCHVESKVGPKRVLDVERGDRNRVHASQRRRHRSERVDS